MQIPILVELIEGERWRATAGAPFSLTAEGPSRREAIQSLERIISARIQAGAALLTLDVPPLTSAVPAGGTAEDDDLEFQQWLENRRREGAKAVTPEEAALDEWFWRAYQEGIDEFRRKDDEELSRQEDSTAP